MDLIDGLKAFVTTAQTGSFTDAAEQMGISNRLTSKYVAELETRVGARLLHRTTRTVSLTPTGQALFDRAPAFLDELEDMLEQVSNESKGLSGLLRISAPVTFGETYIQDLIIRFSELHRELNVDLRLNDAHVDLAKEGFDLAFRLGTINTTSLKLRKLGTMKMVLFASPDYLAKHGNPSTPSELADHACIIDTNRKSPRRWSFFRDGEEVKVTLDHNLMVNSAKVAKKWALQGKGIAYCPEFIFENELIDGSLIRLLDNYASPEVPFGVVYLPGSTLPRKVRTLIDFAVEDVKTKPW